MTFEDFYKELCSDEIWHEQAGLNHKPETFEATARQIWVNGLAEGESFSVVPMKEHRRHLFNKLSKITPDKVKKQWWLKEEEKPEWKPVSWEERAKWLRKWQDQLQKLPQVYAPPKLTSEQIKEEGDWIAKKVPAYPSTTPEEVAKRIIHSEYLKANYDIITGDPLEGWMPEDQWVTLQSL